MKRKILSLFLVINLLILNISGCSTISKSKTSNKSPYKDFIVVDVFDSLANWQGIQSGWFAKIVKDKFNMELNIIAPNVASGGDTLLDTRAASGNVGDLIICGTEDGIFQDLVDEDLILDMSKMLKNKSIMRYKEAISSFNNKLKQKGIYAIPSEISSQPATEASDGLELSYGPYLRWDIYSEAGYPEMSTLEDLLPVLEKMHKAYPTTEAGKKTYGFSFFKDWDANMMNAAKQPACFYGYDELGFVLAKADGSDYQSIIDSNSLYIRNLRLYNKANQMGLVDPDSTTQSYQQLFNKYQDGSILYCPWPWQCQSAFNTAANKAVSKGYMLAPIKDMKIFSYGCTAEGNQKTVISIGSNAKDPKRLADFINWLYSPEGVEIACAVKSSGAAGPEGLTWKMGKKGPYLTDFGEEALAGSKADVPEEWGGGTWKDGVSQLNYKPVSLSDLDSNGYPYNYTLWDSYLKTEVTALDIDWRNHLHTDARSTHEYLKQTNQMIVAPGCSYVAPDSSTNIAALRSQCRSVIVKYSWSMIFAPNDQAFNSMLKKMQAKVKAFDYDKVLKLDLKNAKDQDKARKKAASLSDK